MPKINSLADLQQLRAQAQRDIKTRIDTSTTITIGMGTCGIAAGARETMRAIMDELAKRGIDANVTTVGCIGMCIREPLVDIEQAGKARVTYGNITADKVPELIEQHLIQGKIVTQWVVGRLEK